jgi:hypothetical protein
MFLRNTEGAYLVGHWYGFSSESTLVMGSWLLVRPDRDQGWLNAEKGGRRRLELEEDILRLELLAAIKRGVPIVPVLIDETLMPQEDELPVELRQLCRYQSVSFRHTDFRRSIETIVSLIRQPRSPS